MQSKRSPLLIVLSLVAIGLLLTAQVLASNEGTLFGPKRYERAKGKPTVYHDAFKACANGRGILRVTNGADKATRITSAEIVINGVAAATPSDFKKHTPSFEKAISLQDNNEITVTLRSGDGEDRNYDARDAKEHSGRSGDHEGEGYENRKEDQISQNHDGKDNQRNERDKGKKKGTHKDLDEQKGGEDHRHGDGSGKEDDHRDDAAPFLIVEIIGQSCGNSDSTVPLISNALPADGSLLNTGAPLISVQYADESGGSGIDASSVRLTVDGNDATAFSSVAVSGVSYRPSSNLPEGQHTITVTVSDLAHNAASHTWYFMTDTIAPVITISSPQNSQYLNSPVINVSGSVDDPSATVTVNGSAAQMSGAAFSYSALPLVEGSNIVTVLATDKAGNVGTGNISLTLDTVLPLIQVASPIAGSIVNTRSITVSGSIADENPARLWVNGAEVSLDGRNFSLAGVPLAEGANTITIRAADKAGNESSVPVPLVLDTVPPAVTVSHPEAGKLLNALQIAVSGAVSEAVLSVTVNNVNAVVSGLTYTAEGVPLAEGPSGINVVATDLAGNAGTANVSVVVDAVAPAPPVLAQPASPTKVPQTTVSGVAEANATVRVSATGPNGQTALIGTVSSDAQGGFMISSITLAEGTTTFSATATDAAGNTSVPSAPVPVVLDTVPAVITLTAPANGSSTNASTVQVTGSVDDATASLTVNGTPVPLNGNSFTQGVDLASGLNSIQVAATDPAGNASTAVILVTLDQTPPIIAITSPLAGSLLNTQQATVTGTVNEPVASVTLNGAPAQVSGTGFSLADCIVTEGTNTIIVKATDLAGNEGSQGLNLTVDSQPPALTLAAPSQAAAGATVLVSLNAQDATSGIALVELFADSGSIWSFTPNAELTTQNSISYTLSPEIAPGSVITLRARSSDLAGNVGTATAQVTVSQGPSGPGYVQGEVYDDSRGLLLSGATVTVSPVSAGGSSVVSAATQTDGGYYLSVAKGDYLVAVAGPGYTAVERMLTVKPEQKTAAIDARLTPVSGIHNLVGSAGGRIAVSASAVSVATGTVPAGTGPNVELAIPAGALASQTDLRVTPVSNQGLANLLPAGWAPIAAIDIHAMTADNELGTAVFALPATLKAPVLAALGLAPNAPVAAAAYDHALHQWRVQASGSVSADGLSITAPISATGQYAFVLPDVVQQTPLAEGQPLPAALVGAPVQAQDVTAAGAVVPPVAPPSDGLRATGQLRLTQADGSSSTLTSGLIVNAAVTERFDLLSGDSVVPADYVQDLVLYQHPCATNIGEGLVTIATGSGSSPSSGQGKMQVGSTFPVTPSRQCSIVDLLMGKVGVSITLPAADASGALVGADGGRLLDADGTVIAVPPGALSQAVPVQTKTVAPSVVSGLVGPDFTLLRAVNVTITGAVLSSTAELSIPAPAGFNTGLPVVVARAIDVRGGTRLKLVASARLSGSLITSAVLPVSPAAQGITATGMYFFLQAKAPLGFVTGLVTDASGNPFASALVTTDTCSLADLTGANGTYLVASTVSNFSAEALDIYKYDRGTGTGTIGAAGQAATVNLQVRMVPPRVLSIAPANGETKVSPSVSVGITFSKPLDKATITTENIVLTGPAGTAVEGVFSVSPDGTVVTFYPTDLLVSQAAYTVVIQGAIKDLQGYQLGQSVLSAFTVRNTTPPPMPPAGSITATFPDAEGYVTVTGTQGSAPADCTVLIINDSTGEIVGTAPATDGSFSGRISAQLGNELKIVLMDPSGNQTLVTYVAMKSGDGRYLVTAKGGTVVDEASGAKLDIPEGALFGPTVVKITPVAQNELPQDNPIPQPGSFLSAMKIDTGGVNFNKEVHLSVPVPAGFDPAIPVFVTQPEVIQNADGTTEKVYSVVDSTKIVNGMITTASPPFDGIWTFGIFSFTEFPTIYPAIVDGYTFRDMDGDGIYMPKQDAQGTYLPGSDLPVKNAVVRSPGGWNYVTHSKDSGFYATFTDVTNDISTNNPNNCRDYRVTAIHPQTMNRVTLTGSVCTPPYNIQRLNFKLADATSVPKDTAAPVISMNMQVVPGQTVPGTSIVPQFLAGTIPAGTDIDVPISILDQEIGTVMINVTYKTPDMSAGIVYALQPGEPGSTLYAPVSATNPAPIYKYDYTADFSNPTPSTGYGLPLSGSSQTRFRPGAAGTYTITVDATDASGNKSSRSMSVRAVQFGDQPAGLDGAPHVDELVPADGAKEIMVTMPVMVSFSESVDPATVNGDTFQLFSLDYDPNTQQTYTNPVPASIYTSVEGGKVRATLTPRNNLDYGTTYKVVVTNGIKDYASSNSDGTAKGIDNPSTTTFTTKVPQLYDLASQNQFQSTGIQDIVLYTYNNSGPNYGRTFAYITAGKNGWRVVDVTDPTNPVVVYSYVLSGSLMEFRYLAVDQQTGILAMTDDTQFADGNQYGYVRFYDLLTDPAKPTWIGQERLAEAYSGIPGRVAISNNFAFVSTVNAGLQVVDIEASKNYSSLNPGASIVGVFDTVGQGFRQPLDINVYKGGRAVLTTTSGILLVLDVNQPQFPQLITAYPQPSLPLPAGSYTAWHADVAAEYAYADDAGNSQVMDVAVTAGLDGRVYTVDLTDPYNLKNYGPVKEGGADLLAFATDIKISKASGLVYMSAANGVYVIDIKNPKNPKFLNLITQTPSAPGSSTTTALGSSTALVEKDGWVYLANAQKGLRVLDLDPVWLRHYRDEEAFPDDYYPALGEKAITLIGNGPLSMDQPLNIINNHGIPPKVKLVSYTPAQGVHVRSKVAGDDNRATFNDSGLAKFYVRTDSTFEGGDIVAKFEIDTTTLYGGGTQLMGQNANNYNVAVRLKLMNNSNVTVGNVVAGTAVFVNDCSYASDTVTCGPISMTDSSTTDDLQKKFDFVQQLLNQVIPRGRTVWSEPTHTWVQNNYSLLPEDGTFDVYTSTALRLFRLSFNMAANSTWQLGNTKANFTIDSSGSLNYVNENNVTIDGPNDNTSDTFRKLMRDYGHTASIAESQAWVDKIIDKETLVGKNELIPKPSVAVTGDNADLELNRSANRHDTGLFELYKNIVERFVISMIDNAEHYSGDKGLAGTDAPKDDWVSRADTVNGGYGHIGCKNTIPPSCIGEHGKGMNYCNGCKQNILQYNNSVSKWKAPPSSVYTAVTTAYAGNINDATGWIDSTKNGNHKWPGLYDTEWTLWNQNQKTGTYTQYNPQYWAGIDCIGLVMRNIQAAAAVLSNVGLSFPNVCVEYNSNDVCISEAVITSDNAMSWVGTSLYNKKMRGKAYYFIDQSTASKRLIRKGDVVLYSDHISTVYSDSYDQNAPVGLQYKIIHPYGIQLYRETDPNTNKKKTKPTFSRKVLITGEDIGTSVGFGRIMFWN